MTLPATIHDQKVEHTYAVLPGLSHAALLGVDVLEKLGLQIQVGTYQWTRHAETAAVDVPGIRRCTPAQEAALQQLLDEELPPLRKSRGTTSLAEHRIRLKTTEPIKQRYMPRNPATQALINEAVDQMLAEGVIEPSNSPWSSPVVMVAKKGKKKKRFCIDFRRVNAVTEKDAYPLPQVQATLDKLREARYISTLDLANGYWQVPLAEESRPITAFTVPGRGLYQFRVMPFGLHSAPATFQRLLDSIIGPSLEPRAFAYLDDIIVLGRTFEEHLENLREVLRRLQQAGLRLNEEKCRFCQTELQYLGHVVSDQGVKTDPEKVEAIRNTPPPQNLRELRRFLGMVSWYRRYIPQFSETAAPLHQLLQKRTRWTWTEEAQAAFETLRHQLATAPVLTCPDFDQPFVLQTDASQGGLGAVLTQDHDGKERVVAYASRTLNAAERNYSVTEKECLAVVWGIRKMRPYLEGYSFTVLTDHQALKWLQSIDSPSGRLARWSLELQQYDFKIEYRKGENNLVADALSRQGEIADVDTDANKEWYDVKKRAVEETPLLHPEYQIHEGELYRHFPDTTGGHPEDEWKQCVPRPRRDEILRANHDVPTAGHLGVNKTTARLARKYYWPGMFRDAARYVRQCAKCQEYKVSQQAPAGLMHTTPAAYPWDVVSADLVGPLPRSKKGHTVVVVMQDKFTKWIELQPPRQATAPAVTKAFRERVVMRFGCPRRIITDNGKQFESREFTGLLREYGIDHRKTPPYTPQCNPVERANRVIKTMIAQFTDGEHTTWDHWLPEIAFAYNTARHEATGSTPAALNFGRELTAPGEPRLTASEPTEEPTPEDARKWQQRLADIKDRIELARWNLVRAHQNQKHHYDLRRRDWRPAIGEDVMKREHHLSAAAKQFNAKLAPKFAGPYTVAKFAGPNIVVLRGVRGKTMRAHISDLKPSEPREPIGADSATVTAIKAGTSEQPGQLAISMPRNKTSPENSGRATAVPLGSTPVGPPEHRTRRPRIVEDRPWPAGVRLQEQPPPQRGPPPRLRAPPRRLDTLGSQEVLMVETSARQPQEAGGQGCQEATTRRRRTAHTGLQPLDLRQLTHQLPTPSAETTTRRPTTRGQSTPRTTCPPRARPPPADRKRKQPTSGELRTAPATDAVPLVPPGPHGPSAVAPSPRDTTGRAPLVRLGRQGPPVAPPSPLNTAGRAPLVRLGRQGPPVAPPSPLDTTERAPLVQLGRQGPPVAAPPPTDIAGATSLAQPGRQGPPATTPPPVDPPTPHPPGPPKRPPQGQMTPARPWSWATDRPGLVIFHPPAMRPRRVYAVTTSTAVVLGSRFRNGDLGIEIRNRRPTAPAEPNPRD